MLIRFSPVWHHDGPFDACRPHRNSKKNNLAPMSAFPTGSANNTMGGSGPINRNINIEQYHGLGTESFHDYGSVAQSGSNSQRQFTSGTPATINPINRVEPIHGEETMGLGTSTFLEGAPASRRAIQRTQSEQNQAATDGSLSRKKSIAMRLRGMSGSRRYPDGYAGPAGPTSPQGALRSPPSTKGRFQERSGGISLADGSPMASPDVPRPSTAGAALRSAENNPFDRMVPVNEKKQETGTLINVFETEEEETPYGGRDRSFSSPRRAGLERRVTDDDGMSGQRTGGSGFLSRVKSLKGARRKGGDRQVS